MGRRAQRLPPRALGGSTGVVVAVAVAVAAVVVVVLLLLLLLVKSTVNQRSESFQYASLCNVQRELVRSRDRRKRREYHACSHQQVKCWM